MPAELRIAQCVHSTNPRGGVVHAIELAGALAGRGHAVDVIAPDSTGRGFFRLAPSGVELTGFPVASAPRDLRGMVRQRVDEYTRYLLPRAADFDVWHAHDGISGNALANLVEMGLIDGFARTVHHGDRFEDVEVQRAQDRSIAAAGCVLCVSRLWAGRVRDEYGVEPTVVPSGVNVERFCCVDKRLHVQDEKAQDGCHGLRYSAARGSSFADRRPRADEYVSPWHPTGPTYLAVGGVEERKNTLNILRAFRIVRQSLPTATLMIAGGASLLDHSEYRRRFATELAEVGNAADAVRVMGPVADELMPDLYRSATALVFPSIKEGFGLVTLEAMACGTPVVTSRIEPFTEYLGDEEVLLVDPHDPADIARAMMRATEPAERSRLRQAGLSAIARFPWSASAEAHERAYVAWIHRTAITRKDLAHA